MPIVSAFFGIVIRMFYREHGPPHFHAEHHGENASFTFDGRRLAGNIRSRQAVRLIRRWCLANRAELEANWAKARGGQNLEQIAPLEQRSK
jgi:hypothetical protein